MNARTAIAFDDGWGKRWGAHYATIAINASGFERTPDMVMCAATVDTLMRHAAVALAAAGEIAHLGPGGTYDAVELGKIVGVAGCAATMLGRMHAHQRASR